MEEYKRLIESIPNGRAEAVSMAHLAKVLSLERRELRREIEQARKAGNLICSCDKGYFFPETLEEITTYTRTKKKRIRTSGECLRPFIQEIRKRGGSA